MAVDTAVSGQAPVIEDAVAPPARPDRSGPGYGPHEGQGASAASTRAAVTEVLQGRLGRLVRPAAGGGGVPPRPRRPRRSTLPAEAPSPIAVRDMRWWTGAAILAVSLLMLAFIAHVAVLSTFQHHRAQTLGYDALRESLAKAETPVGQLDVHERIVAPGTAVALMRIPAIGFDEVVREGSTSEVLRGGPGHRRDSVMPGQEGTSTILGRQLTYGGPFGGLNRLVPGAEIIFTTGQGEHIYRVFGLRRAGDPIPEAPRDGQGRLELQTADGLAFFPSGVLYVDAELITDVHQTPSRVLAYAALPESERAMGQDGDAWFIAFFVLMFFAAAAAALWWLWTTWGRWHAWLIGVPVLTALGVTAADLVMNALPNLL